MTKVYKPPRWIVVATWSALPLLLAVPALTMLLERSWDLALVCVALIVFACPFLIKVHISRLELREDGILVVGLLGRRQIPYRGVAFVEIFERVVYLLFENGEWKPLPSWLREVAEVRERIEAMLDHEPDHYLPDRWAE